MYPVLFVLILVAATVVVAIVQRRRREAETATREDVLPALAPVISGSLAPATTGKAGSAGARVLSGTYEGYEVETALITTGGGITTEGVGPGQNQMEAVELTLRGVAGAQPWCFRLGYGRDDATRWWWIGPEQFMGSVGRRLSRMSGLTQDPDLEQRLRQGGIGDALERLGVAPRAVGLPNALFVPDLTTLANERRERYERAGISSADHPFPDAELLTGRLVIEVERADNSDPTPERFREILDAAVGIAELNARINDRPASSR
jgi:hypothetical protein